MILQRIFGLHGSGKSDLLFGRLQECIEQKKQAFLVVPEQAAVSVERMLIDRLGNPANMYIEVINFKRLCNRVFRETGGLAGRVPEKAAGHLAMSHVLSELADHLKEYSALSEDADFAARMLGTVEEMHHCRVLPEDLEEICEKAQADGMPQLASKLQDAALAYRGYEAYMTKTLDFPGDLLDKLYETLCETPFFAGKQVFFDAFYGFTAQELAIIGKIMATADRTCVTLLCESETQDDPMFLRGTSAAKDLRLMAQKYGVPMQDTYAKNNTKYAKDSALQAVSRNFSLGALAQECGQAPAENVVLYKCENIYAESACATKIVSDLLLEGALPREIAVCARDTASYEGVLDVAFEAAGIPFSHDTHTDLSSTPVASLVSAAFEVYFSWSLGAVCAFIKTGLSGLTDREADILELYLRAWNINGKAYMHEKWYMNPDGLRESAPDDEKLAFIGAAKDKLLLPLDAFCADIDNAVTCTQMARAVYDLINNIAEGMEQQDGRFDDGADGEYLDLLYRTLDCMEATLGKEQMTPRRFADLYKTALAEMRVGKIPELIDQVRFSPVTLMRTDGVKYVLVLGANDGVFPAAAERSDIFRDRERVKLAEYGVHFAEPDENKAYDELFLAYTALCSASTKAYILFRSETATGDAMYPSLIVEILKKLLGITEHIFDTADPENAVSAQALFESLPLLANGEKKRSVLEFLNENPKYHKRLMAAKRTDDSANRLSEESLHALYGDNLVSSYSRLEKFHNCPFAYFCTYTLRLTPEVKGQVGAAEYGNIVHKALEELAPDLCERVRSGKAVSDAKIETLVCEKVRSIREQLMPEEGEAMTKRFAYIFSRIEKALVPLCKSLVGELSVSRFTPVDFELNISPDGLIKPVSLLREDGKTLSIVGKIDRVDMFYDEKSQKTWLRITDYKTGSTSFRLNDVKDGFNLQMLLYLYTLIKNGSRRYGNVYPAGVLYSRAVAPSVDMNLADAGSEDFHEPEYISETTGVAVNDFDVIFAMDETASGKYVPVKLSGGILAEDAKNTLGYEALTALLENSAEYACAFASGIARGEKKADPRAAYGKDACEYCDYSSICTGIRDIS